MRTIRSADPERAAYDLAARIFRETGIVVAIEQRGRAWIVGGRARFVNA